LSIAFCGNKFKEMVSATALVVPTQGAAFEITKVELYNLRPEDGLVELKAARICHADLAVQQDKIPMPFPAVLGPKGEFLRPRPNFSHKY